MEGISIYLTGKEREKVLEAITGYIDILSEGEETAESVAAEINNGLGAALFKLNKGLIGQKSYEKYANQKKLKKQQYVDEICESVWRKLEDITFVEEEGRLVLNTDFYIWKKGTDRETIWNWFDKEYSKGVAWLLYEYEY